MNTHTTCKTCVKYRHWWNDHGEDGALPAGIPAFDNPLTQTKSHKRYNSQDGRHPDNNVSFNTSYTQKAHNELC